MKKRFSGSIVTLLILVFQFSSCKEIVEKYASNADHQHTKDTKYTCPMHPQIVRDKPGSCPICGMDLVPMSNTNELAVDSSLRPLLKPVNEQVIATIPTITAQVGTKIFSVPIQGVVTYDTRNQVSIASRVAGRVERMLIKYNYQPVRKGQLIMEVYSADLAAAQRELIYISRNDNNLSLLESAKQRLKLLGMQPAQIAQVVKTGNPIYRVPVYSSVSGYIVEKSANASSSGPAMAAAPSAPSAGMGGMGSTESTTATPAPQPAVSQTQVILREGQYVGAGETVFTVYQSSNLVAEFSFAPSLAASIKKGQKVVISPVANPDQATTGTIGLLVPTQRNGENFSLARVYLQNTDLRPGQLLTAAIPVVKSGVNWLPEEAVLRLGNKSVVFRKEQGVFTPKEVNTGLSIEGKVQILDSISNWQVAENASFLVDSESFIRLQSKNSR